MSARVLVTSIVAAIALAPAAPAAAFVRSRGFRFGECLGWRTRSLSYAVNGEGANQRNGGCPSADTVAAVERGLGAWPQAAQACTDLALTSAGPTTSRKALRDGRNVVLFRSRSCADVAIPPDHPCHADNAPEDCSSAFDCWDETLDNVIATTSVFYVAGTGEIFEGDMEFNAMDSSGKSGFLMTCSDTAPATDIQNVATNEAGHLLGLAHPCEHTLTKAIDLTLDGCPGDTSPTMFPSAPPGDTSKRSLEPDDIAGVCFLYPRGEPAPACVGVRPQPLANATSSCGFGSRQDVLALLAVSAVLLRLRRSALLR